MESIKTNIFDCNGNFSSSAANYIKLLKKIDKKRELIEKISRVSFYRSGLPLITSNSCPFCGKEWEQNELMKIIKQKISELSGIEKINDELETEKHIMVSHWEAFKKDIDEYLEKSKTDESLHSSKLKKIRDDIEHALENDLLEPESFNTYISSTASAGIQFEHEQLGSTLNL